MVASIRGDTQGRCSTNPDPILDLVASSPIAASCKDRERWLALFDADARIEDPAGSAPFSTGITGRGLDVFYDTFIAHSDISFVAEADYVCGRHVARDGAIIVDMAEGQRLNIPIFLRYEVSESGKIKSLRAHWKPVQTLFRTMGRQPGGFEYLTSFGKQLYKSIGFRGIGCFAQAAIHTAFGGRITVLRLKDYLEGGRYYEAVSLFSFLDGSQIVLYSEVSKVHPAGYLTMGELKILSVEKLIDGGRFLSLRCELLLSGQRRSGIAFFTFSAAGFRICRLEIFLGDE